MAWTLRAGGTACCVTIRQSKVSTRQIEAQPSPLRVFPSSQTSPGSMMPSPHTAITQPPSTHVPARCATAHGSPSETWKHAPTCAGDKQPPPTAHVYEAGHVVPSLHGTSLDSIHAT